MNYDMFVKRAVEVCGVSLEETFIQDFLVITKNINGESAMRDNIS